LFAFTRFTANRCSKSDFLIGTHARDSDTAETSAAVARPSARTFAAESIATATRRETVTFAMSAT
jgi:hypothetical protein